MGVPLRLLIGFWGLFAAVAVFACDQEVSWRRVDSRDGRFSVSMPSEARTTTQRAESVHGAHQVVFTVSTLGAITYAVMYVDYPVEALTTSAEVLDLAVKGALDDLGAKDATQQEIHLNGFDGRSFEAKNPSGQPVFGRIFLVGRRLYRLSVSGLNRPPNSNAAGRFLKSFELSHDVP